MKKTLLLLTAIATTISLNAQNTYTFSPEKYKDMSWCKAGTAHIEVRTDGSIPMKGNLAIYVCNNIEQSIQTIYPNLYKDGYSTEVQLTSPIFINEPLTGKKIFLSSGDKLVLTIRNGKISLSGTKSAVEISNCNEVVSKRLGVIPSGDFQARILLAKKEGKEKLLSLCDETVERIRLMLDPGKLAECFKGLSLSNYGKDICITDALVTEMFNFEDIIHTSEETPFHPLTFDKDGKRTNINPAYLLIRPFVREIYDNPLIITGYDANLMINRTQFNQMFIARKLNYEEGNWAQVEENAINSLSNYGIGHFFILELFNCAEAAMRMNMAEKSRLSDPEAAQAQLDTYLNLSTEQIATMSNKYLSRNLMQIMRKAVRQIEGAENDGIKLSDDDRRFLDRLFSPYHGNFLYIDLWALGCEPCKAGMLYQRKIVEEMQGDPIRFIYICDEKFTSREKGEQWMTRNSIRGEHLYLSHEDWLRLERIFDSTSIPHVILVGKDGRIVKNKFEPGMLKAESLRKIAKRF